MIRNLTLIALLLLPATASADTLLGHTRRMARHGRIYHDSRRGGGAEVVARVRPGIGQRLRARAVWMRSAPHRRILLSFGILRVRCWRGYCTGRK